MNNELQNMIIYNAMRDIDHKKMIIYYDYVDGAIAGNIADEFSSFLVGGWPGQGKTSAIVFYCCMIVLSGGQLLIIDPHQKVKKDALMKQVAPLRPWFFDQSPIDFNDLDQVIKRLEDLFVEYTARKNGDMEGKGWLFLVIDEWKEFLAMLDGYQYNRVIKIVSTIATGGRKVGIYIALVSQVWNLNVTGGSPIRRAIPCRLSFACESSDLRMIFDIRNPGVMADLLQPQMVKGDAIMRRPGYGAQRVYFPYCSKKDAKKVADLLRSTSVPVCPRARVPASNTPKLHLVGGAGITVTDKKQEKPERGKWEAARAMVDGIDAAAGRPSNTASALSIEAGRSSNGQDIGYEEIPNAYAKVSPLHAMPPLEDLHDNPLRPKEVEVRWDEREAIKHVGQQLLDGGSKYPTMRKIRDTLGWRHDQETWKKIQQVCREQGWVKPRKKEHHELIKDRVDEKIWQIILFKYDHMCLCCGHLEGEVVDDEDSPTGKRVIKLEPDRIVPHRDGGFYVIDNIQPLCSKCNKIKRAKTIDYRSKYAKIAERREGEE